LTNNAYISAVLGRAPTPADAAHLSLSKIRSALKHAGRQRNIDTRAQEIAMALRTEQLAAPAPVTAAFAATTRASVGIIIELNRQITELEAQLATHFANVTLVGSAGSLHVYFCLRGFCL
jgi:hypothetical protein